MPDISFRQDPHFSTEKFTLQEGVLLVTGGVPPQRNIPLSSISPDYVPVKRRFHSGYLVPLFFAAAFAVAAWQLFQGDHLSMVRAIIAGILGFMAFVFPFLMKFAPIEGARFVDRAGFPLFEIYRPSKSAYTYDEFLSALVQRVKDIAEKRLRT